MASTLFGDHLKREREMRGVSLEEISAATRISVRFLEALENEQWNSLPGGLFNRGFIRSVARYLGLDEESLVAEYAMQTHDAPQVAVWAKAPKPVNRVRLGILLVLLVFALLLGGWTLYARYPWLADWHQLKSVWKPSAHAAVTDAAIPSRRPPVPIETAPSGRSTSTPPPLVPGTGAAPATSSPSSPVAAKSPTTVASSIMVTRPSSTAASGQAAPAQGDALVLKIQAGKPAQVKVVADGQLQFSGPIAAGETQKFQAQKAFVISSSESSAILLDLNGQIMPPLGATGSPGTITLTRKDLKRPQGGQD